MIALTSCASSDNSVFKTQVPDAIRACAAKLVALDNSDSCPDVGTTMCLAIFVQALGN
jgi:hypothetical protein